MLKGVLRLNIPACHTYNKTKLNLMKNLIKMGRQLQRFLIEDNRAHWFIEPNLGSIFLSDFAMVICDSINPLGVAKCEIGLVDPLHLCEAFSLHHIYLNIV